MNYIPFNDNYIPYQVEYIPRADNYIPRQNCGIEDFFKKEQLKPWWLRSNCAYLYCSCPKCNNIMC